MSSVTPALPASRPFASPGTRNEELWSLSQDLEASFLAEMLKSAGLGQARGAFGGGPGEDQFSSFLIREYADEAARTGGIGLRESIYRSLIGQKEALS